MEVTDFSDSRAIRSTRFFMLFAGFWIWKNRRDKLLMDLLTGYTLFAIIFAWVITVSDLWFSRQNFNQAAYAACNAMTVLVIVIKLITFTIRRVAFINLIKFCQENFWKGTYDSYEKKILQDCENRCLLFVGTFTFFANCTVVTYALHPIVGEPEFLHNLNDDLNFLSGIPCLFGFAESMGKNETDRILPFKIWLNFPTTSTPYYEIMFSIETLSLIHSGICYFCFDNFLCLMNVHATGQFRMLRRRLECVCSRGNRRGYSDEGEFSKSEKLDDPRVGYWNFESCVRQHQVLIRFIKNVEDMYTFVILGQVVVMSLLICLVGYQAVLADGSLSRRMIFVVHSGGTFTQLFMFTLTCDDLTQESQAVADGAYRAGWYLARSDYSRRILIKDLMFVIARSRRPCCLTAGGFFAVSVETFRAILSTAMSYLTLLRNGQQNGSQ